MTDTLTTKLDIETIDLTRPPSFVRVSQAPTDLRDITCCEDSAVSAFLYPVDWGPLWSIFDRKATEPAPLVGERCLISSSSRTAQGVKRNIVADAKRHRQMAARLLNSEQTDAFFDKCAELEAVFLENMVGMNHVQSMLQFAGCMNGNKAIHIDDFQVRNIIGLEMGNTLLAKNPNGELATRHKFTDIDNAVALGHRLYTAPFGVVTALRGSSLAPIMDRRLGIGTAHAVFPKPPTATYVRPYVTWDFTT